MYIHLFRHPVTVTFGMGVSELRLLTAVVPEDSKTRCAVDDVQP